MKLIHSPAGMVKPRHDDLVRETGCEEKITAAGYVGRGELSGIDERRRHFTPIAGLYSVNCVPEPQEVPPLVE
jgi:hypothetical protein